MCEFSKSRRVQVIRLVLSNWTFTTLSRTAATTKMSNELRSVSACICVYNVISCRYDKCRMACGETNPFQSTRSLNKNKMILPIQNMHEYQTIILSTIAIAVIQQRSNEIFKLQENCFEFSLLLTKCQDNQNEP